jgi:hypothetical protein
MSEMEAVMPCREQPGELADRAHTTADAEPRRLPA